ncbi:MAG TPA: HAMP domain-containing sensor histidine kinase [Bacteroidia bacterium]|nr:HAMP domain-containing sensor histidine kinase [Bacteroidia bacterium]
MTYKNFGRGILVRVPLLFLALVAAAWFIVHENYLTFGIAACLVAYLTYDLFRFNKKAKEEIEQFVESVHYRDFSRYFDMKHAPVELKPFRKGFNEINSTFKVIIREKEAQHQYMQKILELVDTGIICYEEEEGEIIWINESLKNLLGIPYLKTIYYLQRRDGELFQNILSLKPGKNKVVTIKKELNEIKVLLSSTIFQTEGKTYKLIAFQNVNEALDENESRAWHRLLSVMTHEIMNSVAPISSLADTLKNRLQDSKNGDGNTQGSLEDIELGIDTIKHRSESLMRFAHTYRNLNKITTPNLQKVFVRDLFERLHQLMQPLFEQKNIEMEVILKDPGISLMADTSLLEQVLINLLTNAMNAVKEKPDPQITLSASETNKNKIAIKVSDNGVGIPAQNLDKIFIPFFSTTNSSGIGLSLCKQIMMVHNGNIQVQSVEEKGTSIWLLF